MARRTFTVVDVTEILIHWHAGRSISEMSTSLAVDRQLCRERHNWRYAEGTRRYAVPLVDGGGE